MNRKLDAKSIEGNYVWKNAICKRLIVVEAVAIDLCTLSISVSRLENAKYLSYKGSPLILLHPSMNESIINAV
jgi:hypothetical protein